MRLQFSILTFLLLHSARFVSARWESGLDGDLYGELPRPTSEPLLYRDEFRNGAILMETKLGQPRNGTTTRRDTGLDARQLSCEPGYVLSCPTKARPCCAAAYPICCSTNSIVCCGIGTFCVGRSSCCYDGQVGCTSPEGCCPGGTKCCGIYCCTQGYECRSGSCVNVALSSLSVASVASVKSVEAARSESLASIAAEQSRSLASVASVRSKSIESEASVASEQGKSYTTPTPGSPPTTTSTPDGPNPSNGKENNNVVVVGGAVGGVLGAAVIGLVGLLLWRRNKGRPASPPAGQQPFLGHQPSSQPITPASPTFSTNTSYLGGPPITYAAQAGWQPQQSIGPQGAGSPTAASQQSASPPHTVNTWIDRPPTVYQDNHPSQSRASPLSAAEGPVDPRELYSDALRGSTYAPPAPPAPPALSNVPSSTPGASGSGSAPPPAPVYPFTPSAHEKAVPEKSGPWRI